MKKTGFGLLVLLLPLFVITHQVQAAPADALRVDYHQWKLGKDGIRQEMSYSELLYRKPDSLWIEREIPEAAQHSHDDHHHGGLGHKHADVTGAPLWIVRDPQGKLDVKLIDRHEQRMIEIAEAYYSNVGFDGHWVESWSLADPETLQKLKPTKISENGLETYEIQRGTQQITLVWNPEGQYAQSITAKDSQGLSGRTIRASEITAPKTLPWTQLGNYLSRDYSDLLD
ncbi:hypothetical protein [Cellvibrio mixtus]|uniref:hypothetical protein n=1 Tax=Cellvibrio mixtus TaxID=39650 RepID=UPI000587D27F|nr:hypothetical protein [Cellvibrio mixtus]